jgi:hypothetical protein
MSVGLAGRPAHRRGEFWQWSCPGVMGQADSRDKAMVAIRAARNATDADVNALRRDQEWIANKYALWAADYRDKLEKAPAATKRR